MDLVLACRFRIARGMVRFPVIIPQGKNIRAGDSQNVIKKTQVIVLTPPLSQIKISSEASTFSDGKNQKYNSLVSFASFEIGSKPAYDSPISKSTSGIAVPFTENSAFWLASFPCKNEEVLALSGIGQILKLIFPSVNWSFRCPSRMLMGILVFLADMFQASSRMSSCGSQSGTECQYRNNC